ncbi:MFS transporter [Bacillus massiliglaciei]|uniref:MFS transporter n=1 Tax=Bacillus massiliglaciei TaxID=1816693 RepID=UPI000AD9DF45|nr:MFS transporter [Bacillus massiliglaciei]
MSVVEYIEPSGKAFRRTLWALFLGSFVTFADLYSTQPVIPEFVKTFGVKPATASLTLSFSTGMLAVCLLLVSFLAEKIDRKKLMGTALLLSSILSICVSLVDELHLLIFIRAVQGAVLAGFPAIAMAYINEEFHPKSLGYVIGIYVSGSTVGGLAGRLIVGTLTDFFSWNIAIGVLGIISLTMSLAFWKMLPDSRHSVKRSLSIHRIKQSFRNNLRSPSLVLLFMIGFLLMGSFVTIYNYIGIPLMSPPYQLSQTWVGLIFMIYLVGTFSSAWMGRLADKYRRKRTILSGMLIMGCGVLLIAAPFLALKIIGLALMTFGFFGAHSIASSWVGRLAHSDEKAQASSLYLLFYYGGSSLVGAVGGVFLHDFGWMGVTIMVLLLIGLAVISSFFIREKSH